MGTIGDRLGADLAALFGGDGEAPPDSAPDTATESSAPEEDAEAPEGALAHTSEEETHKAGSPAETISLTITELSGVDPDDLTADTELADIGIDGLALWAVVAELERTVGGQFLDEDVRGWVTVGQMTEAAEKLRTAP